METSYFSYLIPRQSLFPLCGLGSKTSTVQNSLPFLKEMNYSTMPSCKGRPTLLHIHLLTNDCPNRPKAVGVTECISFMKILIDI